MMAVVASQHIGSHQARRGRIDLIKPRAAGDYFPKLFNPFAGLAADLRKQRQLRGFLG